MHVKTIAIFAIPTIVFSVGCSSPKKQSVTILQRYCSAVEELRKKNTSAYEKIDWAFFARVDPRLRANHQEMVSGDDLRNLFRQVENAGDDKTFPARAQEQLQIIMQRMRPLTEESVGLASRMSNTDPATKDMQTIASYHQAFDALTQKAYDELDAVTKASSSFR